MEGGGRRRRARRRGANAHLVRDDAAVLFAPLHLPLHLTADASARVTTRAPLLAALEKKRPVHLPLEGVLHGGHGAGGPVLCPQMRPGRVSSSAGGRICGSSRRLRLTENSSVASSTATATRSPTPKRSRLETGRIGTHMTAAQRQGQTGRSERGRAARS